MQSERLPGKSTVRGRWIGLGVAFAGLLAACAAGQEEKPKTTQGKHVNRLAKETSPYLLQHRHNPVDWYPWGPEALAKAKREQKVIFLSIGYSACHWCHVMERESFENEAIAALLNEHFVSVKVDREERPDLDEVYMAAVQAMTGSGGWPMTVFLTPELQPFFGGTYFPPKDSPGRAGFPRVLQHVRELWQKEPERVRAASKELTEHLQKVMQPIGVPGAPTRAMLEAAAENSASRFDTEHGGFGQPPRFAPKFPHAAELSVLLRHAVAAQDKESLARVTKTLHAMADGGIYDQIGGGFHRYSTDREWLAPHFEKMLYDNAQLLRTFVEAYVVTGDERLATVARETADYVLREMTDSRGGFWSTTDADSEGVEGKFFTWSLEELRSVLGDDADLGVAAWGVTKAGNWEHTNILIRARSESQLAEQFGESTRAIRQRLDRARAALYAHRKQRVAPHLDDKILSGWNALMIDALCYAHSILDEPRYLAAARDAAEFVLTTMRGESGRMQRSWRAGRARFDAYLDDYAGMANAVCSLIEVDPDPRWLRELGELLATLEKDFVDAEDGAFFFTAKNHEQLIARNKGLTESSTPSGMALATLAFLRGGLLLGDESRYAIGERSLRAAHGALSKFPMAAPSMVLAASLWLDDPREIVIYGPPDAPETKALLAAAYRQFPPSRVIVRVDDASREVMTKLTPIVAGKTTVAGKPAAYVCRRGACEAPVTDPAMLSKR